MTTSDARGGAANLEARLTGAYGASIKPELEARLDDRMSRAIAYRRAEAGGGPIDRPGIRPARRRVLLRVGLAPVLVAVLVITVAAGTGILGFFNTHGGYVWDHGQTQNQVKTADGYQVTLLRTYGDANQVAVALSVVAVGHGWSEVVVDGGSARLADSAGTKWISNSGMGAETAPTSSGTIFYFMPASPAPPGNRQFTLTVGDLAVRDDATPPADGDPTWDPWHNLPVNIVFVFDMEVHAGTEVTSPGSAAGEGVTVKLQHVVISPSMVTLDLQWAGLPPGEIEWAPILTVAHDGKDLASARIFAVPIGGSSLTYNTAEGVENASGRWTVSVSSFSGTPADGGLGTTVSGPWVIEFAIP